MKGRLIALDHIAGREAAALMVNGRLEDLLVQGDGPRLGDIHRAIVDRPIKGQGGVIVRLADGATGYLRRARGLAPGQVIDVMVSGYAEAEKAVPVTDRLLFKSRYAIVTPDAPGINVSRSIRDDDQRDTLLGLARAAFDGEMDARAGLILRSASEGADIDEIAEDIAAMVALAQHVAQAPSDAPAKLAEGDGPHLTAWREWCAPAQIERDAGCFEDLGVLEAIEALFEPYESLGAGHMYVEPTRALVSVDVNTGRDTSPAAALKANMAAVRDIGRALTLRGLGGQVTMDLAPMTKRDRKQIETSLRAALRKGAVETEFVGWTPLGHVELKRKRERQPLSEVLAGVFS